MNAKQLIRDAEQRLMTEYHKDFAAASAQELHNALSGAAMDALAPLWTKKEAARFPRRQAAYLSMEFLVGRLIYNNLYCMGLLDDVRNLLKEKGVDITVMEDVEDDAFGNGGLGRLAACFLDSAVTCSVPLTGYGFRGRPAGGTAGRLVQIRRSLVHPADGRGRRRSHEDRRRAGRSLRYAGGGLRRKKRRHPAPVAD